LSKPVTARFYISAFSTLTPTPPRSRALNRTLLVLGGRGRAGKTGPTRLRFGDPPRFSHELDSAGNGVVRAGIPPKGGALAGWIMEPLAHVRRRAGNRHRNTARGARKAVAVGLGERSCLDVNPRLPARHSALDNAGLLRIPNWPELSVAIRRQDQTLARCRAACAARRRQPAPVQNGPIVVRIASLLASIPRRPGGRTRDFSRRTRAG